MKHAKFHRDKEEIIKHIINKQLDPFSVKYEDILGVEDWYTQYEVTQEQNDEWIDYCINYLRKEYGMTLKTAKKEMLYVNLMWGLKIVSNK